MDKTLQAQIEVYLSQLDGLIRRGRELRNLLEADRLEDDPLEAGPGDAFALTTTRVWQQDCAAIINQLSGGSKAHWLARAFSEAFLLRSTDGTAAEGAAPSVIVGRLQNVLELAVASLSQSDASALISASSSLEAPPPRRFEFVHKTELRPVLEQAYADSQRAREQGHFDLALKTSCGILEAIVTDALEHAGLSLLAASGAPPGKIADWSFQTRLTVAERAGLIRGGWARLPAIAWTYRDREEADHVKATERDARLASQVLNVIMRDRNPGR